MLDLPATETARCWIRACRRQQRVAAGAGTMQAHLPARRAEWQATDRRGGARAARPLHRRAPALRRRAALAISAEDIRVTMPPDGLRFDGLDAMAPLIAYAFGPNRDGDWRLVPTMANRMPTAASYLRRRRHRVPGLQAGRAARGGRQDRRDHDLRPRPVPAVRPAGGGSGLAPASALRGSRPGSQANRSTPLPSGSPPWRSADPRTRPTAHAGPRNPLR